VCCNLPQVEEQAMRCITKRELQSRFTDINSSLVTVTTATLTITLTYLYVLNVLRDHTPFCDMFITSACCVCHATSHLPISPYTSASPSLTPLFLLQSIEIMTESNRFQMALVFCKAMIIFEKRCTLNTLALSLTKK
jgi:hypothetical protein